MSVNSQSVATSVNNTSNAVYKSTWAEKAKDYQKLIKDVNALNGSINCGRVALRVDELFRDGPKEGSRPVSRHSAGLFTEPHLESDEIVASYTSDERILERILKERIVAKERIDLSDPAREILELDVDASAGPSVNKEKKQKIEKQYFYRSSKDTLSADLQKLQGRKRDGSKYGFILLTRMDDINQGHLMNFVVDAEGNEFYIDGQPKDPAKQVSKTLPEGFRPEIYYIDSNPPEGYVVKQEPIFEEVKIKAEAIEKLIPIFKDFVSTELQLLLKAFYAQDEAQIDVLSKHKSVNTVTVSGKESIGFLIAKTNPPQELLQLLIKKNVNFQHLTCGAAAGGHKDLMEYVFGLMRAKQPAEEPNLQSCAEWAARGGQKALMEYVFGLMRAKQPAEEPNLQSCAEWAARGGQKALMEYVFGLMRAKQPAEEPNLQSCAEWAARSGQKALMEYVFGLMRVKMPAQEPNLQVCAQAATMSGQKALMEYVFGLMRAKQPAQEPNLQPCAEWAARSGQKALMEYVFGLMRVKMPAQEPNLQFCAEAAARGGHKDLMEYLFGLMRAKMPAQEPNLQVCAQAAARGGQKALMEYVFGLMRAKQPAQEPNLQSCAEAAVRGGQKSILWHLFEKIFANGQVPNFKQCQQYASQNYPNLARDIFTYSQRVNTHSTDTFLNAQSSLQPLRPQYPLNAPGLYLSSPASSLNNINTNSSSMTSTLSSVASSNDTMSTNNSSFIPPEAFNQLLRRVTFLEAENATKTARILALEERLAGDARLNHPPLAVSPIVRAIIVPPTSAQGSRKRKTPPRPGE